MQQRSAWAAAVAGSEGRPLLRTEALWIELGEHIREGKWVPGKSRSPDQPRPCSATGWLTVRLVSTGKDAVPPEIKVSRHDITAIWVAFFSRW